MNIRKYLDVSPQIDASAYVDPQAHVSGDVVLAAGVSIWPMAVLRGDVQKIRVGKASNVQDGSVLHVSRASPSNPDGQPLIIGEEVTIGHNATLHACTIHDQVLIGMGAIVLDKAIIEKQVMIGAGSLVPPGKVLESGYLYLGSPVKQVRKLTASEIESFSLTAQHYIKVASGHQMHL